MFETWTTLYLVATLAMAVVTTLIAVATPPSPHRRTAVALFTLVTLWCLADLLSNLALDGAGVRWLAMAFAPVWIAVPPLVLELATRYTGGPRWRSRPAVWGAMALAAAGVLALVWSGRLYSEHLPAWQNGGAFASRATSWQWLVMVYEAGYVVGGAAIMLHAARCHSGRALRASARFAAVVMTPMALAAIALNSNLLPETGDAPHTASLLLAATFVILGGGMLRRDYLAPIDLARHERDLARDQLLRREQVLGAMPLGVAITAPDGSGIFYSNPQFRALLGLDDGASGLPPALLAPLAQHTDVQLRAGIELAWPLPAGSTRTLQVHASWVEVAGQPVRLIAVSDLSEQKRVEAMIEEQRAHLMHASKMEAIGRLASGIAHDFNNQLTAILGFAIEAARALGAGHPQHADLVDIRRAAERAGVLTKQLLSFGRKRDARVEELELNRVLDEAQGLFGRLLGPGIALSVEAAAGPAWILMDRAQLEQVLMTLIVNAREAMPGGGTLTLRVMVDGARVRLEVADSGEGMTAEVQARLFEPFFSTKGEQGTGLGLTTARTLLEAAGAAIRVRSAPGAGTVFTLSFARCQPTPLAALVAPSVSPAAAADPSAPRCLLLVDDEDLVRRSTARMLAREGYQVLQATSGEDALAKFDAASPPVDVVLTDLAMPGMDGQALAAELWRRRADLPLVFMSGHALAGQGLLGSQQLFVAKPFDRDLLLATLQRSLQGERPARVGTPSTVAAVTTTAVASTGSGGRGASASRAGRRQFDRLRLLGVGRRRGDPWSPGT